MEILKKQPSILVLLPASLAKPRYDQGHLILRGVRNHQVFSFTANAQTRADEIISVKLVPVELLVDMEWNYILLQVETEGITGKNTRSPRGRIRLCSCMHAFRAEY